MQSQIKNKKNATQKWNKKPYKAFFFPPAILVFALSKQMEHFSNLQHFHSQKNRKGISPQREREKKKRKIWWLLFPFQIIWKQRQLINVINNIIAVINGCILDLFLLLHCVVDMPDKVCSFFCSLSLSPSLLNGKCVNKDIWLLFVHNWTIMPPKLNYNGA